LRSVLGASVLVALSIAASGCGSSAPKTAGTTTATTPSAAPSFADVVAKVKTGVIRIEVDTCDGSAIGTGFLVKSHLIATVEHVVDGALTIKLSRNGTALGSATVIGADPVRDLALLRTTKAISGYDFGFAGKAPRLGEEVGAIGFPLDLPLTVTRGSVSGLDRSVPIDRLNRRHMVQTDAAVNHGNSGGPLLSTETGQVVGLVDLGTTSANGIAFAVSAEVAKPLLQAWAVAPQPPAQAVCSNAPSTGPSAQISTGPSSPADYANAVDGALIGSAQTRGDLADLINGVNSGSFAESEAISTITGVIGQRRQLLTFVTAVPAPPAFARSAQLLRESLVESLSDDLAIQSWIGAKYAGDAAATSRYWQQQLRLSTQTSLAKQAFLNTYNAARRNLLGLPPLDVAY
jgi:S1-C subfamily serine protease